MGGKRLSYTIVTHAPAPAPRLAKGRRSDSADRAGAASNSRNAHHFYLVPTFALIAATVIGAWQTGRTNTPEIAAAQGRRGAASDSASAALTVPVPLALGDPLATGSDAPAAATIPMAPMAEPIAAPPAASEAETVVAALTDPTAELPEAAAPDQAKSDTAKSEEPEAEPRPAVEPAAVETAAVDPARAATAGETAAPSPPARESRRIRVRPGATLMNILVKAGVSRVVAHEAITALRPVYDPRDLKAGQTLILSFEVAAGAKDRFLGLMIDDDRDGVVSVALAADGGFASERRTGSLVADLVRDTPATESDPQAGAAEAMATPPAAPPAASEAEVAALTDPTAAAGETAAPSPPARESRRVRVRPGATLMNILVKAGVSRVVAHEAITALRPVYDPRDLKAGQTLILSFEVAAGAKDRFLGLMIDQDLDGLVTVELAEDGTFQSDRLAKTLDAELVRASGPITSSLFEAGIQAGVPIPVMIQFIHLYSFDVDFQRDIWSGDTFEVMFDSYIDERGQSRRQGEILYASLTVRGQVLLIYRFVPADGRPDYFNEDGESARKMLMRTPVDGARLSSRYGRRKHPILRFTRMHRGVDFAAPRGTPVYAAGEGTVARAGRNGAYGRYIKIRHNSTYSTAYAHLNRIAKTIKRGARVRQGQIIGYVGSSGRSTGPHLHYEIHRLGRQINPLKLRTTSGERLKGEDLEAFQEARSRMDTRFASAARDLRLARGKSRREHACASGSGTTANDGSAC